MVRSRGVLLIVFSMVLAVGAAWAANRWLQARAAVPDSMPMATVVTAAMDIPFGTTIETRHLATIQMLPGTQPESSYHAIAEVEGKIARAPLLAGEILLAGRFTDQANGSTLAAVVEKNMRAVTVRVDDVVGVGGFLLPGNKVDVVGSRDAENREAVTETILQNVRVLAVDQTAATEKNEPVVVRAVTLEVTPDQAEVLVKWKEQGSLQLTLRNPLDESVHEKPKPAPVVAKTPVPPKKQPPSVTVIRGTDVVSQKAST
jgi:pilus assembly protein CpaB